MPRLGAAVAERMQAVVIPAELTATSHKTHKNSVDETLLTLIGRTSFGPNPVLLEQARSLGYEAYLEQQLHPETIPDYGLEDSLQSAFPSLTMSIADIVDAAENDEIEPVIEIIAATLLRQIYSPRQLFEVMVEFWNNHFSVNLLDGAVQYFKAFEDRMIMRPGALGRFEDLLVADARSPAMLYYLDNYTNVADGPNENYARELLELHTLGVDGGYTEADVKEVARCFTGWTLTDRRDSFFAFFAPFHDFGSKQVLGTTIPEGQGYADGRQVIRLLAEHPSTAKFVTGKLAKRFVTDQPPPSLLEKLAETFQASGGDIKAVLRALFLDDTTRTTAAQKFKRPVEFVTSMTRTLPQQTGQYWLRTMVFYLQALGQLPLTWPAPNGFPDDARYWVNTTALLTRFSLSNSVAGGDIPLADSGLFGADFPADITMEDIWSLDMDQIIGDARTPFSIVDAVVNHTLYKHLPAPEFATLLGIAATHVQPDERVGSHRAEGIARRALAAVLSSKSFQVR